jgi:Na+-transporting NADH:ubiquinone oxidoreductase subunit NqrD
MFGSSSAHGLGYGANAVLIALIKALVSNGTLTQDQVADTFDDAKAALDASHIGTIAEAARIVDDIKRRVAA